MSELLPCPFCGSADVDPKFSYFKRPAEEGGGTYGHEPGCNACGASAPAEIWNRRSALSQEAVRDEALEEAAKVCAFYASEGKPSCKEYPFDTCAELVARIRALKREPNAAPAVGQFAHYDAPDPDRPAPAAPDVESMVKLADETLLAVERSGREGIAHPALVLAGGQEYKLALALRQAAALLAKLWQAQSPFVVNWTTEGCPKHNGQPWSFTATAYTAIGKRCPLCEPAPGASDDK